MPTRLVLNNKFSSRLYFLELFFSIRELEPIILVFDYLRIPDHNSLFYFFELLCISLPFFAFLKLYGMSFFKHSFHYGRRNVVWHFICLRHECLNISMIIANIATFKKQRFEVTSLIV